MVPESDTAPEPGSHPPANDETIDFDSTFDSREFAPPANGSPSYVSAFDPEAYVSPFAEVPTEPAATFQFPSDDAIPIFDTGAFDAPPPSVVPDDDSALPASSGAGPETPAARDAAPAWSASTTPPAPTTEETETMGRRAQRLREAEEAGAPTSETSPVSLTEPIDVFARSAATEVLAAIDPSGETAELKPSVPYLSTKPPVEALQFTLTPLPFGSGGIDDDSFDLSDLGQGQAGTDPDLVAALNIVVSLGASDLHVSVGTVPLIRVDGALQSVPGFDTWDADKVTSAIHSILSPKHRDQFEAELELDFAYSLSKSSRFRVNIYQQRDSIGAAFRLIPTGIKQLAELGMPAQIAEFAQLQRGLVLVTGPTGSGKSTTLAALIDLVNATRADHIVTVEDPIEFIHSNKMALVNQREVGHDTHSFNNALKHVLRQDPDVILIGELRDLETISVALTAAETGHLVFATLHTQDAPQTIDRLIDVFPTHQQGQVRTQLAATLRGVVCQTLVKHASGQGRVVATEVMVTTSAVANLIREGKTYQIATAMQAGGALGMHTLDQHLADLVNSGEITHGAAREKARDVEAIGRLIHRVDTSIAAGFGNNDALYTETNPGGKH
ncbi:type IV pilus twitching motility protein PilT [Conyzicola nivalis]|uniref:type IV pilus twitching motility protein PilT n=1 Tax=Conyzicola nivalis TaxID=1477021 RepID=UPI0027E5B59E|nr:PilT/PilU family type 4a pilus ATPase [Conyzicola nivalis]